MSKQHTPGPWKISHIRPGDFGGMIAQISTKRHLALAEVVWRIADESRSCEKEANARLIAAAPDLLAFAKRIAALPHHGEYVQLIEEALAAINKATGE